jgi:hypothetical protein
MNRALMQIKALDRFVFRISEWKKLSSAERDDATRFSHVLAGKEEGAIMRTIALLLVTVLLSAGALALHPENTLAYGGGGFGRGGMAASASMCTQQRVCDARSCAWRTICR